MSAIGTKRGITIIERMLGIDHLKEAAAIVHASWWDDARHNRYMAPWFRPKLTIEEIDPLPSWPSYPVMIEIRGKRSS